jgi:L-rhamnose mutarotase
MPKRYGMVIRVRPEKLEEYVRLHAAVWPEVLAIIREVGIRNYSIFLKDDLLFGYMEFEGGDIDAAFRSMNARPVIQEWYAHCSPCQEPLPTRRQGEWWAFMEEVFHTD